MLGSIAIAVYAFATIPGQRSLRHVADRVFRFLIGSMWWQQTLWKLPPYYTDHPDEPATTGRYYWMTLEGKSATIPLQADLVNNLVLPNFHLFAPIVYSLEVLTAVSLILGIFVPVWGLIGALQIPQSVARSLQRRGRVALDLFLPPRVDADLRGPSVRQEPRPRRDPHPPKTKLIECAGPRSIRAKLPSGGRDGA
jgi:hypothetical protein